MRPIFRSSAQLFIGFIFIFILSACGATEAAPESGTEPVAKQNTPVAVAASVPPTATSVPPTVTTVPPTATAPPTATEAGATATLRREAQPTENSVIEESSPTETIEIEIEITETATPLPPTASASAIPTNTPTNPSPTPEALFEVANVASNDILNVRFGPGVGYQIVGTIPYDGTDVEILGPSREVYGSFWVPVRYKEVTGWVNRYYLATAAESSDQAVGDRAREILLALKNKDMATFANMVHPDKGVRFSAYTYVRVTPDQYQSADLLFSPTEMSHLFADPTVYHWGVFDGIGDPIKMTFADYFERFVYDVDFANPDAVAYNQMIGQGNTINNIVEIYPEATVVEYYLEGSEEYGGLDWRSLRLVLEKKNEVWYLVAVVHDEWTI